MHLEPMMLRFKLASKDKKKIIFQNSKRASFN
jgi:hypothetical protein